MALNILIVDDSQIVRTVIAKSLDLANVPVKTLHQAGNGAEALQILVSHPVDLVFADINMPVMGGVEMVERMSRDDQLWSIPIVIVSTEGSATRVEGLKSMGVRAYLRKPFKPEAIRAVVDQVMGVPDANG
jgi:two-component system, chemotaxis family, chemotaxis protein CheY